MIGRLKPGVTIETARAELSAIAARLAQQYPADNEGWGVLLLSFYDWLIPESTRQSLVVLQGAVGLVLLIACVNVANLLLARGAARQKELAIRVAIGASRGRIMWHGALESLLLGGAGRRGGRGPRRGDRSGCCRCMPRPRCRGSMRPRSTRAVLAFAVARRRWMRRAGWRDPVRFRRRASRARDGCTTRAAARPADGRDSGCAVSLTVAEVALSVALLIGAGLLLRSFVSLQQVNAGFDVNAVMTGRVMLADAHRVRHARKARRFLAPAHGRGRRVTRHV